MINVFEPALWVSCCFNCSFGEENGWRCKEEFSDFVWVLDPIDGTKSFITGMPLDTVPVMLMQSVLSFEFF